MGKALEVTLRKGETQERMIKRFTKNVRDDGILKEHSHKKYFEKPSTVRRRKRAIARWNSVHGIRK